MAAPALATAGTSASTYSDRRSGSAAARVAAAAPCKRSRTLTTPPTMMSVGDSSLAAAPWPPASPGPCHDPLISVVPCWITAAGVVAAKPWRSSSLHSAAAPAGPCRRRASGGAARARASRGPSSRPSVAGDEYARLRVIAMRERDAGVRATPLAARFPARPRTARRARPAPRPPRRRGRR